MFKRAPPPAHAVARNGGQLVQHAPDAAPHELSNDGEPRFLYCPLDRSTDVANACTSTNCGHGCVKGMARGRQEPGALS